MTLTDRDVMHAIAPIGFSCGAPSYRSGRPSYTQFSALYQALPSGRLGLYTAPTITV